MSGNYKALGVGAAALFSASAYFNYRYVSAHRLVTASPDADGPAPGCAFDRLADRYDEAVGQEEGVRVGGPITMLRCAVCCDTAGHQPGQGGRR